MDISKMTLTQHVPDPNYVPDPQEIAAHEAADLEYRNLMAAYDLLIEHEIDPVRIERIRSLQSLASEDFK